MKRSLLLILFTLMSFIIFSQDLKPDKVLIYNTDTLFAWKLNKCRFMAKRIEFSYYCDSITSEQDMKIMMMDSAMNNQTKLIDVLNLERKNSDEELNLAVKENTNLNNIIQKQKGEIRLQKFLKVLGFIGTGSLAVLYIVK